MKNIINDNITRFKKALIAQFDICIIINKIKTINIILKNLK